MGLQSARCCPLHPGQTQYTRGLRWTCLNFFHKVNSKKDQKVFQLEKVRQYWATSSVSVQQKERWRLYKALFPCSLCPYRVRPYCSVWFQQTLRFPELWQPLHRCPVPRTVLATRVRTGSMSSLHFPHSPLSFYLTDWGLLPCAPEEGTATLFLAHGFSHLFLWKKQPLKEGKIKDTQFFTSYTKESLSDRSIKLLGKQAPMQAAIRDLSSFPLVHHWCTPNCFVLSQLRLQAIMLLYSMSVQ